MIVGALQALDALTAAAAPQVTGIVRWICNTQYGQRVRYLCSGITACRHLKRRKGWWK